MADTVIENLITKLSFDWDEEKLESFDKALGTAVKGLTAVVVGATAAAGAIFAFTKEIAEANDELGKFAQRTGIDVEALQELGFVAELNGASIQSMNSSLENLSKIASEAARGVGSGVEAFGMLGVSVTDASGKIKPAEALFEDVADSIANLDTQAQKLELSQKLGIGGDLLLALQQGSEEIRKQRQEARALGIAVDENAATAAANFNDAMLRQTKIVKAIASTIGTRLMKQITPMIDGFVEWFKINKEIIQQNISVFLDRIVKSVRVVFSVIGRVVAVSNSLAQAMGGWKTVIAGVTAAFVAMNASALLMPVLLTAAAAGLFLLIEDLIKFAEGGDSAIGNLVKEFPNLEAGLRTLIFLLGQSRDGWKLMFTDGGKALEGFTMMMNDAGKALSNFIEDSLFLRTVQETFQAFVDTVANGWKLIFSQGGEAFSGFKSFLKDIGDAVTRFVLTPFEKVFSVVERIVAAVEKLSVGNIFGGAIDKLNSITEKLGIGSIFGEKDEVINPQPNIGRFDAGGPQPNIGGLDDGETRTIQTEQGRFIDLSGLSFGAVQQERQDTQQGGIVNRTVNNNQTSSPNINITITGGNTEEVKEVILDVLNQEYRSAQNSVSSQVES